MCSEGSLEINSLESRRECFLSLRVSLCAVHLIVGLELSQKFTSLSVPFTGQLCLKVV